MKSKKANAGFTAKEEKEGYKVCYDANTLANMDNLQNKPKSKMRPGSAKGK
jgi:hypothetical protein